MPAGTYRKQAWFIRSTFVRAAAGTISGAAPGCDILLRQKYDYEIVPESWECLPRMQEGQSIGWLQAAGLLCRRISESDRKRNGGWKCQPLERFPLLVKAY